MYEVLVAVGLLFYLLGGIAWFLLAMVFAQYKRFAVPAAAILAFAGTLILIFNAVIHPDSIRVPEVTLPDVSIPEINVPSGTR